MSIKSFSFVHVADLHLDSPFKGISSVSDEISNQLKEATFAAFDSIIGVCIDREVDFLLVAGDVYDGVERSLQAQLRFQKGLRRLSNAGIRSYVVHGNHDPLDGWLASLEWPDLTHVFSGNKVETVKHLKNGEPVAAIFGLSFRTKKIMTNLVKKFPSADKALKDLFKIGLLHCNLDASTGHAPYAPCTLADLKAKNYDYWALGHVHTRSIVNEENPTIIYPGNSQGINPNEIGARGCYLISVDSGKHINKEFIAIDNVRWFKEMLSIEEIISVDELINAIGNIINDVRQKAEERPAILRLTLSGRSSLHRELANRNVLHDILTEIRETEEGETQFVWPEEIKDQTRLPIERDNLLEREDFLGELIRGFDELFKSKKGRNDLRTRLVALFDSPGGTKWLEHYSDERLAEILRKAESICLDQLFQE